MKILTELAFDAQVASDAVQVEGISGITADDIQAAYELGYVIKHVATAELADRSVSLRAAPVMLPRGHQLASIRDENNAVLLRGDAVGDMLFSGKGAGPMPSASAVLSDVVDIACHEGGFRPTEGHAIGASKSDYESKHYLRFSVDDPSAIGPITTVLERNGVEIARAAAVWAKGNSTQHQVRVMTAPGPRARIDAALLDVTAMEAESKSLVLRVAE